MAVPFEESMKELMAEFDKARTELASMQKNAESVSHKSRSKNRMLSVTVDGRGEITELKFHNQNWRTMAPGELGKVIVQTIKEAKDGAQQEVWAAMGSVLPAGVEAAELATGKLDWSAAIPEDIGLPDIVKEFLKDAE